MRSGKHGFMKDRMVFALCRLVNRRDAASANIVALKDFSASFVARLNWL